MTPREYGEHLAALDGPARPDQIEAAARILATVEVKAA